MNQQNLYTGVSVRIAAGLLAAAVVVVVTIALTRATPPGGPPRTGLMSNFILSAASAPAPQSPFVDDKGVAYTLANFRDRIVLVNFWATWCAPCVREMPSLKRLQAKLGGGKFAVLALSEDRRGWEVIAPFLAKLDLRGLPAFHDVRSDLMRAFSIQGLPTTILFGRDGREIGRLVGAAEWDSAEAIALVEHYLAN